MQRWAGNCQKEAMGGKMQRQAVAGNGQSRAVKTQRHGGRGSLGDVKEWEKRQVKRTSQRLFDCIVKMGFWCPETHTDSAHGTGEQR